MTIEEVRKYEIKLSQHDRETLDTLKEMCCDIRCEDCPYTIFVRDI